MKTDQQRAVQKCKQFIKSLKGEVVTPAYARQMAKLYRAPTWGNPKSTSKHRFAVPLHSPL